MYTISFYQATTVTMLVSFIVVIVGYFICNSSCRYNTRNMYCEKYNIGIAIMKFSGLILLIAMCLFFFQRPILDIEALINLFKELI